MSPELDTLDQLLGGELPLAAIRPLYPDTDAFMRRVFALFSSGDVCLFGAARTAVPSWRWRELFVQGAVMNDLDRLKIEITKQGILKIEITKQGIQRIG